MKRPVTYRTRFTYVFKPTQSEIHVDISGQSAELVAHVANMLKEKVEEKEPNNMDVRTIFADSEKRWYDFLKWFLRGPRD